MRRIVVTGMGIVSPIGSSVAEVTSALVSGTSGIQAIPQWGPIEGLRSLVCGKVEIGEAKDIPRTHRRTMGRVSQLAALAARQAVHDSGLDVAALACGRAGVVMGSTMGSVDVLEHFFGQFHSTRSILGVEGTMFMKVMGHTVAANVAAMLGTRGPLLGVCSACTSSTQSVGLAYEMIQHGQSDIMVCGGADELHPASIGVFDVLGAASRRFNDTPSRTPRPFDADRDGLVLSEGAAVLVLEEYEHACRRGALIHGEILSYATNCDASHMTQPGRESIYECMCQALESAGVGPADLDYINAHATGTVLGDAAEACAIAEMVGDRVPVSATKGHTGHTLAACGAMEIIFCLSMMRQGFLAPTLNLDHVDPQCAGIWHVRERLELRANRVLSSNFAFGGVNASILLGRL